MTKRASFYLIGILFIFILGGWFAYEKSWEYRVKEGAKALGYELNDKEVKYWVERIRSYNKIDGFDEDIEEFVRQDKFAMPPTDGFLFIGSSQLGSGSLWKRI